MYICTDTYVYVRMCLCIRLYTRTDIRLLSGCQRFTDDQLSIDFITTVGKIQNIANH